jgi:GntR family transcriptional repressor for pyruvate dehydrogenase complex
MTSMRALAPQPAVRKGRSSRLPDAVLRPVKEGNAFESTVEHLATAIRLGVFAEGERLPSERELADRLGIGRATLREAIGALRQAGLVSTKRGRAGGTVVLYQGVTDSESIRPIGSSNRALPRARFTPQEVRDALVYRGVVEPGAAEQAAKAELTPDQRSWLAETLRASCIDLEPGARRVADSRLHLAIATLSGSALLIEAVTQARALTVELLTAIPVLSRSIAHSDAQHADIVDAVLSGDHVRARAAMAEHCEATSALLRALLG